MKILILHKSLVTGGVERVLLSYLNIFLNLKIKVELFILYDISRQENHLQSEIPKNIQTHYILNENFSQKFFQLQRERKYSHLKKIQYETLRIYSQFKIRKALLTITKTEKFDLIIDFNGHLDKAPLLFRKIKSPIIRWCHSQIWGGTKTSKIQSYLSQYHKIIAVCHSMATELTKHYPIVKNNIFTLFNPINIETINREASKTDEYIPSDPYLLCVSRLVKGKGLLELVDIYADLKEKGITYPLYIIGNGDLYSDISNKIKEYHLENNCILLGEKTNPYPYFKNAKLFLFTSESEGLGMVLLESLIFGVPIIAMDCPTGPREIIGHHDEYGKLIPMHNKEAFVEAVLELSANPVSYQHYVQQSLIRIQDFSSEKIGKEIAKLFRAIIAKNRKTNEF